MMFSVRFFLLLGLLTVSEICRGIAQIESAFKDTPSPLLESIGKEVENIFQKAHPAVVKVKAVHPEATLCGTGFYINGEGHLITALAIIGDSNEIRVIDSVGTHRAKLIGKDQRTGVAYLKIEKSAQSLPTPYLKLATDSPLRASTPVIAIGYPLDLPPAPIFGFITGFDVFYNNRIFATTHIRSDISLTPGQLGCPLLNTRGEAIGIMVMSAGQGKFSFALPAQAINKAIQDIDQYGKVLHGWVGVGVHENPDKTTNDRSAVVSILFPDTPAEKSGIKVGDVLLQLNGKEIYKPSDVLDVSYFSEVGKTIQVTVLRDGQPHTFEYTVTERPAPRLAQSIQNIAENSPTTSRGRFIPKILPTSSASEHNH